MYLALVMGKLDHRSMMVRFYEKYVQSVKQVQWKLLKCISLKLGMYPERKVHNNFNLHRFLFCKSI